MGKLITITKIVFNGLSLQKKHRAIRRIFSISSVLTIVLAGSPAVGQVNLPPVNLGDSNFMDGVAGPGWLFQETLSHYRIADFTNSQGGNIPGDNESDITVALSHLAVITEKQLWGGFYGAEILLPVVKADISTDFGPQGDTTGVGDLIFSPLLIQWTDSELFGKPYWHRLNINFVLPTGEYEQNKSVNIGNNVLSFNPYYAFTLELSPEFEVSGRLHYLWNSKNKDPSPMVAVDDTQPGQAFHMNYAASYAFKPGWRLGVAGYYLQQLTEHRIDGVEQADSKEQVFAIGPGLRYANQGNFFYLNAYFESNAENRTEGNKLTLRYSKVF
ncbi:MAG: transporter [Amphritea sp.]